jgi:hypothetical protein
MKLRYVLVGVTAFLVGAPVALAGPATEPGYGGGGAAGNEVQGAAGAVAGGSLPFTGLDLALLVVGGLMLLVVGMVLRRAVRRSA